MVAKQGGTTPEQPDKEKVCSVEYQIHTEVFKGKANNVSTFLPPHDQCLAEMITSIELPIEPELSSVLGHEDVLNSLLFVRVL